MNGGLYSNLSQSYSNKSNQSSEKDLITAKFEIQQLIFEKIYRVMVNLERLTLPFFDTKGNTHSFGETEIKELYEEISYEAHQHCQNKMALNI